MVLAGNGFGVTILFLTLFATQYSGNTFFAFTGATYRIGYAWILSLHFMTAVVVCYLIFAPRLHALARERGYLTPADFVQDRYGDRLLTLLVTFVMIVVLCNFLLAQLMAMGRAMQGLANDQGALAYIPGLEGAAADQAFGRVLRAVQEHSAFGHALVVVTLSAVLAAMMSTADSALLSISSMLTKDVCATYVMRGAREQTLTRVGKISSWLLVAILIGLALALREQASLVEIMDRKLDLLIQLAPAFMLGIRWPPLRARAVLFGLVVGVTLALLLAFGGFAFVNQGKIFGFHPGLVALVPNLGIAVAGSWRARQVETRHATPKIVA